MPNTDRSSPFAVSPRTLSLASAREARKAHESLKNQIELSGEEVGRFEKEVIEKHGLKPRVSSVVSIVFQYLKISLCRVPAVNPLRIFRRRSMTKQLLATQIEEIYQIKCQ
jgi:hypothetical protein